VEYERLDEGRMAEIVGIGEATGDIVSLPVFSYRSAGLFRARLPMQTWGHFVRLLFPMGADGTSVAMATQ
jgi:hypothetical protein